MSKRKKKIKGVEATRIRKRAEKKKIAGIKGRVYVRYPKRRKPE